MGFINSIPSTTSIATGDIQADAITNAKIADDAINSEHYTDGSIDTAHVADNQITTAKIGYAEATLTDGSTIEPQVNLFHCLSFKTEQEVEL